MEMAAVVSSFSTSLDGFIADPDGQVGPLFDWYFNGDVEIQPPGFPITFRMSKPSARYWQEFTESAERGAFVCGRRIFDLTNGWNGNPPMGRPTFVVTHRPPPEGWPPRPDAPFTFVTDGLESALAQAKAAGDGGVGEPGEPGPNRPLFTRGPCRRVSLVRLLCIGGGRHPGVACRKANGEGDE
jgi:dihydrofolate reductase